MASTADFGQGQRTRRRPAGPPMETGAQKRPARRPPLWPSLARGLPGIDAGRHSAGRASRTSPRSPRGTGAPPRAKPPAQLPPGRQEVPAAPFQSRTELENRHLHNPNPLPPTAALLTSLSHQRPQSPGAGAPRVSSQRRRGAEETFASTHARSRTSL